MADKLRFQPPAVPPWPSLTAKECAECFLRAIFHVHFLTLSCEKCSSQARNRTHMQICVGSFPCACACYKKEGSRPGIAGVHLNPNHRSATQTHHDASVAPPALQVQQPPCTHSHTITTPIRHSVLSLRWVREELEYKLCPQNLEYQLVQV